MMILWVLGTFAFVGPFFSLKKIKDYLLRLHWHKDKINHVGCFIKYSHV